MLNTTVGRPYISREKLPFQNSEDHSLLLLSDTDRQHDANLSRLSDRLGEKCHLPRRVREAWLEIGVSPASLSHINTVKRSIGRQLHFSIRPYHVSFGLNSQGLSQTRTVFDAVPRSPSWKVSLPRQRSLPSTGVSKRQRYQQISSTRRLRRQLDPPSHTVESCCCATADIRVCLLSVGRDKRNCNWPLCLWCSSRREQIHCS